MKDEVLALEEAADGRVAPITSRLSPFQRTQSSSIFCDGFSVWIARALLLARSTMTSCCCSSVRRMNATSFPPGEIWAENTDARSTKASADCARALLAARAAQVNAAASFQIILVPPERQMSRNYSLRWQRASGPELRISPRSESAESTVELSHDASGKLSATGTPLIVPEYERLLATH
jgi:hypothetical protein